MNQMRRWMHAASVEERRKMAELAGTTLGMLQQIAGGYKNKGLPQVRSGLARRIEQGAAILRKANRQLPEIVRTDLSAECRGCDYAQKCLGQKAVRADFDHLEDGAP